VNMIVHHWWHRGPLLIRCVHVVWRISGRERVIEGRMTHRWHRPWWRISGSKGGKTARCTVVGVRGIGGGIGGGSGSGRRTGGGRTSSRSRKRLHGRMAYLVHVGG
jgi:hypothetical protein